MKWRTVPRIVLATLTLTGLAASNVAYAVLTHRYDFETDANDKVGTAHWTVNGATISGGSVHFDGVDDFLERTSTILPTGANNSTTIEVWGTYDSTTAIGSRIFDFSTVGGDQGWYMYLTPLADPPSAQWRFDDGFGTELGPIHTGIGGNTGQEVLYTLVYDHSVSTPSGDGQLQLYVNGGLVATDTAFGLEILEELAPTSSNRLGHGQSVPGPGNGTTIPPGSSPDFLTGSINEFRVYNTALSATDVLYSAVAGPDTTNVSFIDKTWNAANSDWNTGGNWTAAGAPTEANRAILGNAGTANVTGAVPVAGAVRVTNGTISVGAGGVLESKFPIEFQPGAAGSATINVNNGGRLVLSGLLSDSEAGAKTINVDNGTIASGFAGALVTSGAAVDGTGGLTVNVSENGMTFDSGSGQLTWSSTISGSGDIRKVGSGVLGLRASAAGLGQVDQNPGFSGEFYIDEGAVDVFLDHGVFGTAGSTKGGSIHLNDSRLVIRTATLTGGFNKEFPADVHVSGDSVIQNNLHVDSTQRMQGSISGDGTLTFVKPNLATPTGIDFENRPATVPQIGDYNNDSVVNAADYTVWRDNLGESITLANEDPNVTPAMVTPEDYDVWKANFGNASPAGGRVDNSGFTGRIVVDGDWAIRWRTPLADFPNAIFDLAHEGAWAGKRGDDVNQLIELGGLAGVTGARLVSAVAGDGDPLADVTYRLGGASQDADFAGTIFDSLSSNVNDNVTVEKVGNNKQTFSGPNTYSGTTTVNGGTLLVNGTHQMDATTLLPVGDYTVNAGGTLGGSGVIGSTTDLVDVIANGGTIAPGDGVGTLTVNGNATFGDGARFAVEIMGSVADMLSVANLNLASTNDFLDISLIGGATPGDYVIATYSGALTGTFNNVTPGYTVNYATPGQVILTVPASAGLGAVAPVPEPTSAILSVVAGCIVALTRRRR